MQLATLTLGEHSDGRRYLSGTASYAIETGTLLVLRKLTKDEWELVEISKLKRCRDNQSVLSFCDVEE